MSSSGTTKHNVHRRQKEEGKERGKKEGKKGGGEEKKNGKEGDVCRQVFARGDESLILTPSSLVFIV